MCPIFSCENSQEDRKRVVKNMRKSRGRTLHDAARSGDVDSARKMLKHDRYDVNCIDDDGWTPLHYACAYGHVDMARMLISEFHADKTVYSSDGSTPLHVAALNEKEEVALAMITEFDCDANTRDCIGRTVLHCACEKGLLSLVQKLVHDRKVDINAQDEWRTTPLHAAAMEGKEDISLALTTEYNCDISIRDDSGKTALHYVCERGQLSLVQKLVHDRKADINAQDRLKNTPLLLVAMEGKENVALTLIGEYNCDISIKNYSGKTALHYACERGCLNLVKKLAHKTDAVIINAQDKLRNTLLHRAVIGGKEDVALALIAEPSCDTNIKNSSGRTALHYACARGWLPLVQKLVHDREADINAQDTLKNTPLLLAVRKEKENLALTLIGDYNCDISIKNDSGKTALHYACETGCLNLVKELVHKTDAVIINAQDGRRDTLLHRAVIGGKEDVALALITEPSCDTNIKNSDGRTALHYACVRGWLSLVQKLIYDRKADINAQDIWRNTPLLLAVRKEEENVALTLIDDYNCDISIKNDSGKTALHYTCERGLLSLVQKLVHDRKADINTQDNWKNTPLLLAAMKGKEDVALALITEYNCDTNKKNDRGRTALHYACERGLLSLVRKLVHDRKADINAQDQVENTPFILAVREGKEDIALVLITKYNCDTNIKNDGGKTALLHACKTGCFNLVKELVHKTDAVIINAQDGRRDTLLHRAVIGGKEDVALALITEPSCDTNIKNGGGKTALHYACETRCFNLVKKLVHKTDAVIINAQDERRDTLLHRAVKGGKEDVALALITEPSCDTSIKNSDGRTALHCACERGLLSLVQKLVHDRKADINIQDKWKNTPLLLAAMEGKEDVALALITEYNCDSNIKNDSGKTALHYACDTRCLNLVKKLVHKTDAVIINVQDRRRDTLLHRAVKEGKEDVALALITEPSCDTSIKNRDGETALHYACERGCLNLVKVLVHDCNADVNAQNNRKNTPLHLAARQGKFSIIESMGKHTSPLATNEDGDTPLHMAAARGHLECVEALLQLDIPVMLRNANGDTARDIAQDEHVGYCLHAYIRENKGKIYTYKKILGHAEKKHPNAMNIARVFVIGNPGAGKSSFVESMKREGFFASFRRVSDSTVPLHTAGIVPSIHTSKHYGRVLFYDFAGNPEYYSSHAAILENLASSNKGDNIFFIVVDLTKDISEIRSILNHWLSFVEHQKFSTVQKNMIVIGSHSDLLTKEMAEEKRQQIISSQSAHSSKVDYFTLDCCKPKSKQLEVIKSRLVHITKDSPRHKLSLEARVLLALLEKDFSNVTACSAQKILSHIEETGISLPKNTTALSSMLEELHDLGLLFTIRDSNCDITRVILNISRLTNNVHKMLYSTRARAKNEQSISSFNVGILPESFVAELLPKYITKECLVELQYCQEISQDEVGAFPSITQPDSSSQSFLFFPALCTVDKSEVPWDIPSCFSYSIGWLARCVDTSRDYFPPRFLHVLLLRLVFRFTLAAPVQQTHTSASPDHRHLKRRRCTMWKSGIRWSMREGVECMVELVNGNKGVVVTTKSKEDAEENCVTIFHRIISCVMEAKADFCHSIEPHFFLLDPSQSEDYLNDDNLFAMSDIKEVLASPEMKEVFSLTGRGSGLERKRIICLCKSPWNSLFSLDYASVLQKLQIIVQDLYKLGVYLNIPRHLLDAIETDFPQSTERRRIELVRVWLSSSPDPPCWWHLVQALQQMDYRVLAKEIETEQSKFSLFCPAC
jgi:ankyrin repeat protein/GTPase SAR1 family protein